MGIFYIDVAYRRLGYTEDEHNGKNSLLWLTLALWITLTTAQDSAPTTPPPCQGTFVDSGYLPSPNYPLDYPNDVRCSWRLLAKSNYTSIRIHFNSFSLEQGYDFVSIYDEKNFLRRYTGNTIPPTMILGREAVVEFTSDSSNGRPGFSARFESHASTSPNQCVTSDTFWCTRDRKCISSNWRCDGYADCISGEDELRCTSETARTTPSPQRDCHQSGSFWCSRSLKCVPSSYRCDNYNDCAYGEDEAGCSKTTSSSQGDCQQMGDFWCSRSSVCIQLSYKCDNYSNCNYGEDEANCSYSSQQHCQQMQRFWCVNSGQCIDSIRICDNTNDCLYGEDEQGCTHGSSVNTAAIVAGTVCGVVVLVLFVLALLRAMSVRRMKAASRRPNNTSETNTAPRPPAVRPTPPAPVRSRPPAPVLSTPPAPVLSRPPASVLSRPPAPVWSRPPAPVWSRPPAPVWSRPPAPLWSGPTAPVWSGPAAPVWSGPAAPVWSGPPATVWSRPPVPVWSTPATNYVQFEAPSWQAGGRQGPDGLPMELYVPHSYVVTNQVYATSQQANPVAQSGEVHPPAHTPDVTAQSTQ